MSHKSGLQVFCQKQNIKLPVYTHWSSGPGHMLEWFATVTLIIGSDTIQIQTVDPFGTKVAAENEAAALMMVQLDTYLSATKPKKLTVTRSHTDSPPPKPKAKTPPPKPKAKTPPTKEKKLRAITAESIQHIYLIDLENKPCFTTTQDEGTLYIGFISSTHNSLFRYENWHRCHTDDIATLLVEINTTFPRLLYVVEGGIPDIVDHHMSAYTHPVSMFSSNCPNLLTISIISGDHAGWCTKSCLEKVMERKKQSGVKVRVSTVID